MDRWQDTFRYITPEAAGVASKQVEAYVRLLEKNHFAVHNLILTRGNKIFFEHYWPPFHREFRHRMYSVTKSFVSIAIGFLVQEGRVSLDDPIGKFFPQEMKRQTDPNMRRQTIRHMLMMSPAKTPQDWFGARTDDRVRFYFENDCPVSRLPGTQFEYDSPGSFVLGALVERVTGQPFLTYLKEKLLREIGVSEEIECLSCPGGHSWADSGLLCRPIDLLLVARFMLNGGRWNGKQILDESYVKSATQKQIDNNPLGILSCDTQGYGYQFWMSYGNSFFFNGMGCQYAVCVPETDMIMVINGDNQGKEMVYSRIIDGFFEFIVHPAAANWQDDSPGASRIPLDEQENGPAYGRLCAYARDLKLLTAQGERHSPCEARIKDISYRMSPNRMGITWLQLSFDGNRGTLSYANKQGNKTLFFGMGSNVFGDFPQEGYSDVVGSVSVPGHRYRCAASAAWVETDKLRILVQIIDRYYGNLNITLSFKGDRVSVLMVKAAEDFLDEYSGWADGRAEWSPLDYARASCDTIMRRFAPQKLPPEGQFHYHQGVFLSGMYKTYQLCGEKKYIQYIKAWVDSILDRYGCEHFFDPGKMDDMQPGILFFPLLDQTGDKKYKTALDALMKALDHYPRNERGGLWHQDIYPDQMWLDGLYMSGPLCAEYASRYHQPLYGDLVAKQAVLMRQATRDPETGLWHHAWDGSGKAGWRDPKTGRSPEFWGRSMGWAAVALLDDLDFLPVGNPNREMLTAMARDLLQNLCRYQSDEGRWYQVVNKGGQTGNWLENSCSCLYVAALYKAVRLGVLSDNYLISAQKGYRAVIHSLDFCGEDLRIGQVCVGTGVGDYTFYCERPTSVNDLHGVGAFLLMCAEAQQTIEVQKESGGLRP